MSSPVRWTHELHVAPAPTSPAQARDFVEQFCDEHDLPYLVDDMRLVVSELVTNAVVHARTRIRVGVEELESHVRLTVYDESLDVPVPSPTGQVRDEDEGGRGLWVVERCSADWGTELAGDQGKFTWALFPVLKRDMP